MLGDHSSSASIEFFPLFTHIGFSEHRCVSEIFGVEIFSFLTLGMACIANDGQAKTLISYFLGSENLLET